MYLIQILQFQIREFSRLFKQPDGDAIDEFQKQQIRFYDTDKK